MKGPAFQPISLSRFFQKAAAHDLSKRTCRKLKHAGRSVQPAESKPLAFFRRSPSDQRKRPIKLAARLYRESVRGQTALAGIQKVSAASIIMRRSAFKRMGKSWGNAAVDLV